MALKPWQTKPENDVACGQCGSVYEKTMQRFPMRDSDSFNCEVCGHRMDSWNSTSAPSYKLKEKKALPQSTG